MAPGEMLRTVEMLVSLPIASRGNSLLRTVKMLVLLLTASCGNSGGSEGSSRVATYCGNVGFVTDGFAWK